MVPVTFMEVTLPSLCIVGGMLLGVWVVTWMCYPHYHRLYRLVSFLGGVLSCVFGLGMPFVYPWPLSWSMASMVSGILSAALFFWVTFVHRPKEEYETRVRSSVLDLD